MSFWYTLWPFVIFSGYLEYFVLFWYVLVRKIWPPCYCVSEKKPLAPGGSVTIVVEMVVVVGQAISGMNWHSSVLTIWTSSKAT
jgi:hypothetical protein